MAEKTTFELSKEDELRLIEQPFVDKQYPPAKSSRSYGPSTWLPAIPIVFHKSSELGPYARLDDASGTSPTTPHSPASGTNRLSILAWVAWLEIPMGCYLPLAALTLEAVMLILFLSLYMSLPLDPETGVRKRIASQYSAWPFISCVGSTRTTLYKSLSIVTCICSSLAAALSFYNGRELSTGYWFRRAQPIETIISSGLLIWLIFASSHDPDSHLHIMLVALRLLFLFATKMTSSTVWYLMRKAHPALIQDRLWMVSYYWKAGMLLPGAVGVTLANVGAFTCHSAASIQTKGTTCYNLIFAAAVSDWVYSLLNITVLFNMSYDFYHGEHYDRARRGLAKKGHGKQVEDGRVYVGHV